MSAQGSIPDMSPGGASHWHERDTSRHHETLLAATLHGTDVVRACYLVREQVRHVSCVAYVARHVPYVTNF